jgi:seryl-tRNA synthetase
MSLQKILDELQPYVIGIRYLEGKPLIDTLFKDGWVLPESGPITKTKGDTQHNYYMIYGDKPEVNIDDLLNYVKTVINVNIEKEKKQELLREIVSELKIIFKKNSLSKLKTLKYSFGDVTKNIEEFNLDISETESESEPLVHSIIETPEPQVDEDVDVSGQLMTKTSEDIEREEEDKRAMAFLEAKKNKSEAQKRPAVQLPSKPIIATNDFDNDCDCGENEACSRCIESKDY